MNSRIRRPLYIFPLNPDYVAARSLRSLRSNYINCPFFLEFNIAPKCNRVLFALQLLSATLYLEGSIVLILTITYFTPEEDF